MSSQALRTAEHEFFPRRCHQELMPVTIDASGYPFIENVSRCRPHVDIRRAPIVEAMCTLVIKSFADTEAVVVARSYCYGLLSRGLGCQTVKVASTAFSCHQK
jgi:hypothetical protein